MQKYKNVEIRECPTLVLEIWFTDGKESDLAMLPCDLKDAQSIKKELEKGVKTNFIKVLD